MVQQVPSSQELGTTDDSNPGAAQPSVQGAQPGASGSTGERGSEEGKLFTHDYVSTLRSEAADWRTKYQTEKQEREALQQKLQAEEQSKLSEDEKVRQELEQLKTDKVPTYEKRLREMSVELSASKLGIIDPEAASKLVDWSKLDATDAQAVHTALEDLVKAKPWLKKVEAASTESEEEEEQRQQESTDGKTPKLPKSTTSKAAPSDKGSGKPLTFSKADLRKLTPEQINDLYENGGLKEAVAEGRVTD